MNTNLHRAHLCNVFDLEYRLVSALIADGFTHKTAGGDCIRRLVNNVIECFYQNFYISGSHYHLFERECRLLNIGERFPALLAEITWSANIILKEKHVTLLRSYKDNQNLRTLSRIERLTRLRKQAEGKELKFLYLFDQSNLPGISRSTDESLSIHISPYQSMSLGHMVFYAYALASLENRPNRRLIIWARPNTSACHELLTLISRVERNVEIMTDPWALTQSEASEALQTDHLFHFMHYAYPINTVSTYNKLTRRLQILANKRSINQNVFCHVRTSDYKQDVQDINATSRNSDPKIIAQVVDRIFASNTIYMSCPSSLVQVNKFVFEDPSSPIGRKKQMLDLFSSEILITPTSGFTLFAHFGPQHLWFYNATHFLFSYPLPESHLISPKRMTPKANLTNLTPKDLARMLLDDFNTLHDYIEFSELSYNELCVEGELFKQVYEHKSFEYTVDIDVFLSAYLAESKTKPVGLHALPKRVVSKQTLLNVKSLFDLI